MLAKIVTLFTFVATALAGANQYTLFGDAHSSCLGPNSDPGVSSPAHNNGYGGPLVMYYNYCAEMDDGVVGINVWDVDPQQPTVTVSICSTSDCNPAFCDVMETVTNPPESRCFRHQNPNAWVQYIKVSPA